jgi:hypothetical protein
VLDHAQRRLDRGRQFRQVTTGRHGAVEDVVGLVGDQGGAVVVTAPRRARSTARTGPGRTIPGRPGRAA